MSTRAAVLIAVVAVLGVPYAMFFSELKRAPQAALCAAFGLAAVLAAVRAPRLAMALQIPLLGIVSGSGAAAVAYALACRIAPPVTAEGNGVMPMGQAAIGLVVGIVCAMTVGGVCFRWRQVGALRSALCWLCGAAGIASVVSLVTDRVR